MLLLLFVVLLLVFIVVAAFIVVINYKWLCHVCGFVDKLMFLVNVSPQYFLFLFSLFLGCGNHDDGNRVAVAIVDDKYHKIAEWGKNIVATRCSHTPLHATNAISQVKPFRNSRIRIVVCQTPKTFIHMQSTKLWCLSATRSKILVSLHTILGATYSTKGNFLQDTSSYLYTYVFL